MVLGELGDAGACEHLIPMLKGHDPSLLSHAVTAIGKIGCSDAIPALIELRSRMTDDSTSTFRRTTVEATIEMLQNKGAGESK